MHLRLHYQCITHVLTHVFIFPSVHEATENAYALLRQRLLLCVRVTLAVRYWHVVAFFFWLFVAPSMHSRSFYSLTEHYFDKLCLSQFFCILTAFVILVKKIILLV